MNVIIAALGDPVGAAVGLPGWIRSLNLKGRLGAILFLIENSFKKLYGATNEKVLSMVDVRRTLQYYRR